MRPLRIETPGNILKEMSDANLEYVSYVLRTTFASQLNAGTITTSQLAVGSVSGYTSIGTATNTIATTAQDSAARTNNSGDDTTPAGAPFAGDWPSAPGTGSSTVTTYNYYQDRRVPAYPGATAFDDYSYLGFSSGALRVAGNTESQIYDEIVFDAISEMKTGDEVGTYRVSTATPSSGGAGTWVDKGTWFQDTTYSAGTTTYKLYLKTNLTTAPSAGTDSYPVRWTGTIVQKMDSTALTNLVTNCLLPVLRRRLDDGNINYAVSGTAGSNIRGTFVDKRQTSSTTSYAFTDPTYYTYSTPSGSASDINTYYLNLTG